MSISDDRWFEVWFVEGEHVWPTYLLIVTPDSKRPGHVVVLDPQKNYEVVHQGEHYDDTMLWLREDEFSLADGRVFADDGSSEA